MQLDPSFTPSPSVLLSAVLAYFALSSSITWFPLTVFLASLIAYASPVEIGAAWPNSKSILTAVSMLAVGESLARLGPGVQALSTPIISIIVLLLGSSISASIFLIPVVIFVSTRQFSSSIVKIVSFPALWATTVTIASHSSPVGRVGVWSPVYGMECYRWLLPYFGEAVQDWIVGLSAVLVLQVTEQAHWSPPLLFIDPIHRRLVISDPISQPSPFEWSDEPTAEDETISIARTPAAGVTSNTHPTRRKALSTGWVNLPVRSETIFTAALLAILALPSIAYPSLVHAYPERSQGPDVTSLPIACIMPTLAPSTSPKTIFETYRAESAVYGSSAKIHLWPESAVRFDTAKERSDYIEAVRRVAATYGIWIGVGFDDFAPQDAADATRREGLRRNGLALVGPQGVEFEYLKQNLVPSKISFCMESEISKN